MKISIMLFMASILSISARAEYPYETLDDSYRNKGPVIEVFPSSPVRAQDGIGLCYGFSATSLLENYRCKELNLSCSESNNLLSSLDVTSYYEKKALKEGGNTYRLLNNVENSNRKIASEDCIKFSAIVHQMADYKNNVTKDEKRGWIFLIQKWNEFKGIGSNGQSTTRNDCVSCLADSIKSTLVNIETPKDQLKDAFLNAKTLEEFLYKSLLPAQCLEESKILNIPAFKTRTYPGYNGKPDADSLSRKIISVLEANIPLEMSICTGRDFNGACLKDTGHSIALFGLKEVCSYKTNECRQMVKVKNSYGNTWQRQNNDGWVDLSSLVENSLLYEKNNNISWLEKPGFVLPEKAQIKKPAPPIIGKPNGGGGIPSEYKNYKGIWKCPGSKFSDQYETGCVPMK
ncbi:MAG: hypothetical protein WC635_17740 [Bacteriovorax sp.]|jgi:hypothetical protein